MPTVVVSLMHSEHTPIVSGLESNETPRWKLRYHLHDQNRVALQLSHPCNTWLVQLLNIESYHLGIYHTKHHNHNHIVPRGVRV